MALRYHEKDTVSPDVHSRKILIGNGLSLLPCLPPFQRMLVDHIVLVDVADVPHRLPAYRPQNGKLHVPEPAIGIEIHSYGFFPGLADLCRSGIVGCEGKPHPVPLTDLFVAEVPIS